MARDTVVHDLWCDDSHCLRYFGSVPAVVESDDLIRRRAARSGWLHDVDGRDLCPTHAAEIGATR